MHDRHLTAALAAVVAMLCSGTAMAAERAAPGTHRPKPSAAVAMPAAVAPVASSAAPAARPKLVDINSASRAELKTLPGIGDVQAERIIAGRPYLTKARLASDNILTETEFFALKGRIVAVQKKQAPAKPNKHVASPKG